MVLRFDNRVNVFILGISLVVIWSGCQIKSNRVESSLPSETVIHPLGLKYDNPSNVYSSFAYERGQFPKDPNVISRISGPSPDPEYGIIIWQICKLDKQYLEIIDQHEKLFDDYQSVTVQYLELDFDKYSYGNFDGWGKVTTRKGVNGYTLYINREYDVLILSMSSESELFREYREQFLGFLDKLEVEKSDSCKEI